MALESPFGQRTRLKVLDKYFASAGTITIENAWEHVYRLLLWIDEPTRLAHVYDSNHMRPGGVFHSRAGRFTDALCDRLGISRTQLGAEIDVLFRGCVEEMLRWEHRETDVRNKEKIGAIFEQEDSEALGNAVDDSDLILELERMLRAAGLAPTKVARLARNIEKKARHHFTIGNKRKNALGEGFEDVLHLLLVRVAGVPPDRIRIRARVSDLPGFKRSPGTAGGRTRSERLPKPDIAIVQDDVTHVITSAKWSMRQDRETQFAHEYDAYQKNKVQRTELVFYLLTNEFDVARLDNVARAIPEGTGGYIFHNIFHINPELLAVTQGDQLRQVGGWIAARKIRSLADFLYMMQEQFGPPTKPRRPSARKR